MAKRLVLSALQRVFADYIVELNEENLRLGVWNGRLELENLQINNEAINALQLPVRVISGEVLKLKVYIPWLSLDRTPIRIEIDGVYLLMSTVRKEDWSSDDVRKRKLGIKRSMVDAAMKKSIAMRDSTNNTTAALDSKQQYQEEGYISRLVQRIIDNMEIRVKNVHVRYEDSNLGAPEGTITSIGVTLGEFLLTTTDENFEVAFVDRSVQRKTVNENDDEGGSATFHQPLVYKFATLKDFGLYWQHSDTVKISEMSYVEDVREALNLGMTHRNIDSPSTAGHGGFLLRPPHDILLKVVHDEDAGRIERAYYCANLDNAILDFDLSTEQLEQALTLKDGITALSNWSVFSSYRPTRRPQDDPRAWWRYAYMCITGRGHGYNKTYKILTSRKSYIQAYKLKVRYESNPFSLDNDEEDVYDESAKLLLDDLEYQLSVQTIVLFRELADSEMRAEDDARKRQQQQKVSSGGDKKKPEWMCWLFFGRDRKELGDEVDDELDIEMVVERIDHECTITEEMTGRKIGITPTNLEDIAKPLFHIELSSSGTLGLQGRGGNRLLEVHISSSLKVEVKRVNDVRSTFKVANFNVVDLYTQAPFFPRIVEPLAVAVEENSMDKSALMALRKLVPNSTESTCTPLLSCQCQISPQGTDISISALPLRLVYNSRLFAILSSAFQLGGRRELESIQESIFMGLEEAKGKAAAYVAQTQYMRVRMDIQAPLIVIPSNTTVSPTQFRTPTCVSSSSGAILPMVPNTILYVDCGKIMLNGGAEACATRRGDNKYQKWKAALTEVQVLIVRSCSGSRRLMIEPFRIEANASISPPLSSSSFPGRPSTDMSISLLPKLRGVACPADVRAFREILDQVSMNDEEEDLRLGLQMLAPNVRSGVANMVEKGEALDQVVPKGQEREDTGLLVTSDDDTTPSSPSHTNLALSMSVGGVELVLLKPREDDDSSIEEEEVDKELFYVHLGEFHTDVKICPRDIEIHIGFCGLELKEARGEGGGVSSLLPGQQHTMRDMVYSTNDESDEDLISVHVVVMGGKNHLSPAVSTAGVVDQPLSSDPHQYGIYANLRFRTLALSLSSSSLDSFSPFFTAFIGRDNNVSQGGGQFKAIESVEHFEDVEFYESGNPELFRGVENERHKQRRSFNRQSFIGSSLNGIPSVIWQTAFLTQKEMENRSLFVECHLKRVSLEMLHNSTISSGSSPWGEAGDPVIRLTVSQLESEARFSGSNTNISFSLYEVRIMDARPVATSNAFTVIFAPITETESEVRTNVADQQPCSSSDVQQQPCSEPLVEASYTSSMVENRQDQNMKIQLRRFHCNFMTGPIKQGLRLAQETQEALWRMMGIAGVNRGEGDDYARKHETVMGRNGSGLLSTVVSNLASLTGRKAITTNADVCKEQLLNVSFKLCEAKFQLIEDPSSLRARRLVLRLSAAGVLKRCCDVGTIGSSFHDNDFKASIFGLESFVVHGTQNRGDLETTKQISEPISANIGAVVLRNMGSLVSADLSLNLTELHTELSYMDILLVASAVMDVLEQEERKNDGVDNVTQTNSGVMHTSMLGTQQQHFTMEELMVAGEIVELGEDLVEDEERSNTLVSQSEKIGEQSDGYISKCVPIIRIAVNWNFARVVIMNDFEGLGVPVLSFSVSDVVFEGGGPVTELLVTGRMILEAQFFNAKVAQWEPVLEPWHPKFRLEMDRDWRINVQITDVHDNNDKLQPGLEKPSYCPLLINVSEEMLESISSTYWMLFLDSSAVSGSGGSGGPVERGGESSVTNYMNMRFQSSKHSFSLPNEGGSSSSIARGGRSSVYTLSSANFTFWNNTGLEVVVSTVCAETSFEDISMNGIALESGCSCNLSVDQCDAASSRGSRGEGLSLWWKGHLAENREPFQKLQMDKCGKFLYSLVSFDPPPAGHVYAFPVVEETWEYSQFNHFSCKWVPPDPAERPRWATRDYYTRRAGEGGRRAKGEERRKEDIKLPNSQWEWLDDWHPDKSSIEVGEIDEEGWEYAVGFNQFNVATKSRTKRDFDQARRRRWIRTRAPCPLPLEDPHRPLDLVLDVQVTPQGRLEVKASSTICIINETRWPLEVSCLCSAWQDNSVHLGTIAAHHMHYVPLLLAYASHYQLRPAALSNDMPDFSWCSPFAVYANGLNESLVVWATCACSSDVSRTSSTTETLHLPPPVHLVVYVEREGDKLACLRVVPPLIVVNALPCGLRFRAHQHKYDIQAELQSGEKVQQPRELQQQMPSSHKWQKQSMTPCDVENGRIAPADSVGLYCVYMYAQAEIAFRVPHFEWSIEHIPCLPSSLKDVKSKFHDMHVEFRLHDGAGGYLHVMGKFERQFPQSSTCPAVKLTVYVELWLVDRTGLSIDFEIDGMKVAKPMTIEEDGEPQNESKDENQDIDVSRQMPSVENLWTESQTRYSIGTVTSGRRIYVDRAYSFLSSTIPPNLRNCILIQTANGDKNEVNSRPSKGWLQFRITCSATVYLLFDSRAISVPQWIFDAGFQRTRQDVVIKHSGRICSVECCFSVYATTIEEMEGKVICLGGNKAPGASTMYIVIVGPIQKQYVCAAASEATSTTSDHHSQPSQSSPLIAKDMENAWTSGRHGIFLSKRGKGLLKIGVSEQIFVSEKRNTCCDVVGYHRGRTTGAGGKTYWSEILHLLGAEGAGGIVMLTDGTCDLEMTFRIERLPAIFMTSMKVTALQRFAVVNLLPVPLQLRQVREGCITIEHDSAPPDVEIPVGSWSAWRWKSVKGHRLLRLRVPNSNWSLGGVPIDVVGLTALHLPPQAMEEGGRRIFKHHVISVHVKLGCITDDFSLQIVVWGTSRTFIPQLSICRLPMLHKQCIPIYRLVNMSDVCVIFWQVADDKEKEVIVLDKGRWILRPGSATSFGWSYLDSPKQLNIKVNGESNSAKLPTEGIGNMVQCPGEAKAFAQVLVQGGTKTILVTRVPPEKLCWKDGRTIQNPVLGGRDTTTNSHKSEIVVVPSPICVSCTLRGISFSLIGSQYADVTEPKQGVMRHELVYAQVSDIKAKVMWGLTGSVEVEAAGIQIDNHVDGRAYPVMLGNYQGMNEYPKSGELKEPLVRFSLVTQLDERSGTRHYEYVALRVLDLLAQADSASSIALLSLAAPIISYLGMAGRASERRQSSKMWLSSFTSEILHRIEDERSMNTSFGGGWLDFNHLLKESESQTRVFFREIVLHPIVLTLNWAATSFPPCLIERAGGFATSLSAIPTLSHSRLSLSSCIAEDVFGFQEELGKNILAFYKYQVIGQVLKLIGSLRALGSPADLVSGVGSGAKALLYVPIQGNILNPTEYIAGITSGVELFARETVTGVFNAMAGLGGGASNLAAKLAFDDTYNRKREARNIHGMVHQRGIGAGLVSGGHSVVGGVADGVSGIFTKPFEAAKSEGVLGCFKGAGQGIVGVVVKPIVGAADGAIIILTKPPNLLKVNLLQSVSNSAATHRNLVPLRLPRALATEPETGRVVLEPYNAEAGQAQALLSHADFSGYAPMDGKVAIMSSTHILLQNVKPSPFAPMTLLESYNAKTLSQAMESVRKAVMNSGMTATAHYRIILQWEEIAYVKVIDGAVVLCMYGDSDIRLDCSKREAKVLYKMLAAHALAMGDPTRVRTYDSVFGSGEAKADIKRKGGNEEAKILSPAADKKKEEEPGHPKAPLPSSPTFKLSVMGAKSSAIFDSLKDHYRLASRKDQIPVFSQYDLKSASEEELLADAERQLKKVAVGLWQRCVAFINSSRDSVQFHNIVKREGKAYRFLEGHDWDSVTHQLRPSGVGILFAWGHPRIRRGNVVIEVETSAFSGIFTLKTSDTKVVNKDNFCNGFMEKIMTAGYTTMVLAIT